MNHRLPMIGFLAWVMGAFVSFFVYRNHQDGRGKATPG